jgi:hypothetical protein
MIGPEKNFLNPVSFHVVFPEKAYVHRVPSYLEHISKHLLEKVPANERTT